MLEVTVKTEAENTKLLATSVENISQIAEQQKAYILLSDNADISALYDALERMENGNNALSFIVQKPNGRKVEIETKYKKRLSVENRKIIASIPGVEFFKRK